MTPAGPGAHSLDDEVLWPVLDRVARGAVTVRPDKHGWPWYYDGDRHSPFSGYLLEKLVEQGYARWDSMVGQAASLRVRQDGIIAVKLDNKGRELHKRLSAGRVLDAERAACASSPLCGLSAICGRCGWTTWPRKS